MTRHICEVNIAGQKLVCFNSVCSVFLGLRHQNVYLFLTLEYYMFTD